MSLRKKINRTMRLENCCEYERLCSNSIKWWLKNCLWKWDV